MVQFEYEALDDGGQSQSGLIEASDRRAAVASLSQRGQFVTSLATKTRGGKQDGELLIGQTKRGGIRFGMRGVNSKDILAMTGQLSAALQAGLALMDCLGVIAKQTHKPAMKELLGELIHSVSSGNSLSDAMAGHDRIFSGLYRAMIKVGETGGILEQTMGQLTQLLKRDEQIKSNIKTASAYPLIVLGVGMISVVIIITWILPKIVATIVEEGAMLPWPTKVLMGMSDFVVSYGWLVGLVVIFGFVVFRKWVHTDSGRFIWDSFKLKVPFLGPLRRTIAVGRFTRTLGALSKGGITILDALHVVRDTLGNELLARQIDDVSQKVKSGQPLAEPLEQSGNFPPLLVQIVSVGEQTGKLDELLLGAADTFDSEADTALVRFMAVLPAVLVLILAVIIGFIVAGTLLPIVIMELGAGGI